MQYTLLKAIKMFKQMFDTPSSTLTYLIVDDSTREAVIIDPVDSQLTYYLSLFKQLNCTLKYALETHVHADHITASGLLREKLGIKTGVSAQCGAATADLQLKHGDNLAFGSQQIKVIATPGHTQGSLSFLWQDRLMTGDALLIKIGERLKTSVRGEDVVGRLSGDKFIVLLRRLGAEDKIARYVAQFVAYKLIKQAMEPVDYNGNILLVGASVGIRLFTTEADVHKIISEADVAMYRAKENGKGCAVFFDE